MQNGVQLFNVGTMCGLASCVVNGRGWVGDGVLMCALCAHFRFQEQRSAPPSALRMFAAAQRIRATAQSGVFVCVFFVHT